MFLGETVVNASDIANASKCDDFNCPHLDVGHGPYQVYNFFVILLFMPIVCIFGIVANIVCVLIFSSKHLRSNSGNTYLIALAWSDFFLLITSIIVWMDTAQFYVPSVGYVFRPMLPGLAFGNIASLGSSYLTVAATFDCFIRVCYPEKAEKYCRPIVAFLVTISIITLSIAFNLPRFWFFESNICYSDQQHIWRLETCVTEFFLNDFIQNHYGLYISAIIGSFIPFTLLCILNFWIVRQYRLARACRKQVLLLTESFLTPHVNRPLSMRYQDESEDDGTITMIMVVGMFLSCNSLDLIISIIETFRLIEHSILNYLSDTSSILVLLNAAVNLILYLRFGKEFRSLFVRKFCCWDQIEEQSILRRSTSGRSAGTSNNRRHSAQHMGNGQRIQSTNACEEVAFGTLLSNGVMCNNCVAA